MPGSAPSMEWEAVLTMATVTTAHGTAQGTTQRAVAANADRVGDKTDFKGDDKAIEHALASQLAEDWQEASRRWRAGRQAFPDSASCWASEIAMLLVLDRYDEAESVGRLASEHLTGSIALDIQRLNVAIGRRDWANATIRLRAIEAAFPGEPFVKRNRHRLAETIASGLRALGPDALMALANKAEADQAWILAAEYWAVLAADEPGDLASVLGYGRALRHSGQLDLAEPVLRAGVQAHPGNIEMAAHFAEVAAGRQDWAEAARRWATTLAAFPDVRIFDMIAVTAFREARDFARAEEVLARAIALQPETIELRVHHAIIAERQEDWGQAAIRWDVAHRLKPDDLNIQNSRGDAIWQEQVTRLERNEPEKATARSGAAEPQAAPAPVAQDDAAALKRLVLRFEGLGDHCEFGIVQRRLGGDPIGLFRFAAISAETLTGLLGESFAKLGDPAFTELGVTPHEEYLVRDTRGLYHMHTFVSRGSVDEAKFLRQQVVRLGYLKKKLVEDLEEGQKIFVHKSSHERISDKAAAALHAAVERFGRNILLVIRGAEDGHAAGSVSVLRDRLLVGHVNTPYGDDTGAVDLESWRTILEQADLYRERSLVAATSS